MEKEERAALAARLKAFLLATEKNYLDGIADNLIHQAEVKTAILSDNEAREPEFVFISYLKEIKCWNAHDGSWKENVLTLTNLTGTAFALMEFDPAYNPIRKDPVCGCINSFIISEEYRQKGIGSLMIKTLEARARGYGVHILFVNWDIKPEPETWADKWLAGMGYHQDKPNDPRPFHYYMMHKRLVDRY